jgi:hypothetical protein
MWNGRKLNDGERTVLAIRSAEGQLERCGQEVIREEEATRGLAKVR